MIAPSRLLRAGLAVILLVGSGAEVGAEVGLPANSVYVNAARVLERIREQCAAYREDLGDD